jgi:hypothetical protein
MFLLIALVFSIIYIILRPMSKGLFNTSMWVAKILAPENMKDNTNETKLFLKTGQAALMEGWLSTVPFITSILSILSIISGFIYNWWAGFLIFFILFFFGTIAIGIWNRSVEYYLILIYHKMVNRFADYEKTNDYERADAAKSYIKDLEMIMLLYKDSHLKPPTTKQFKKIPFGNVSYWLEIHKT